MRKSTTMLLVAICILAFVTAAAWYVLLSQQTGKLEVAFLNIGQGDSIFIQSPTGKQVVIDGGPGRSVIRELSQVMPLFDRSIDLMLATHPDADHITGLIDILERYRVGMIVQSSVEGDTDIWRALQSDAEKEGARLVIAKRGEIFDLGGGAYLEILFPDRPLPKVETNTGSIVAKLIYGGTSFLLTGDSPSEVEKYLVRLDAGDLHADILKAGHHGSKNSSSLLYLGFVHPESVVFSRGCNNKYGHPNPEAVARIALLSVPTLDTCIDGRVTFVSDGVDIVRGDWSGGNNGVPWW